METESSQLICESVCYSIQASMGKLEFHKITNTLKESLPLQLRDRPWRERMAVNSITTDGG
jgi:hypothetical protein